MQLDRSQPSAGRHIPSRRREVGDCVDSHRWAGHRGGGRGSTRLVDESQYARLQIEHGIYRRSVGDGRTAGDPDASTERLEVEVELRVVDLDVADLETPDRDVGEDPQLGDVDQRRHLDVRAEDGRIESERYAGVERDRADRTAERGKDHRGLVDGEALI